MKQWTLHMQQWLLYMKQECETGNIKMKHLKKSRSLGGHLEYATIDSIPRQRQTSN